MVKVIFATLLIFGLQAHAGSTHVSDEEAYSQALQQTTEGLRDPAKRQQMLNTEKAKQTDQSVQQFAGSKKNADSIYDLSADVFTMIQEKSKGDPAKMQQLLEQAQKDPAAFANSFTPEQQAKLRHVSSDIDAKKAPVASPH